MVKSKYFTFQNKQKSFKQVVIFAANIAICYLVTYGVAKPLIRYVLSTFDTVIQDNVAMLVGMVIFVGLNYIGQKFVVFRNEDGTK